LPQMLELQHLEPGWNQGRGIAVTRNAGSATLALLAGVPDLIMPDVAPLDDGGLLLEWEFGPKALQVEVSPNRAVRYGAIEYDEMAMDGDLTSLRQLLEWLVASPIGRPTLDS